MEHKAVLRAKSLIFLSGIVLIACRYIWPRQPVDPWLVTGVGLCLLPWLLGLIKSAKLPGGIEIELHTLQNLGEAIKSDPKIVEAESRAQPVVSEADANALLNEIDPALALVKLRIEIERRLRKLTANDGKEYEPLRKTVEIAANKFGLNQRTTSALHDLIAYGNQAAHGQPVDPAALTWAAKEGPEILRALDSLLSNS